MKGARLLVLAGVVVALVALVLSFDGAPAATDEGLEAPVVPAAGDPAALSSTWFCAAGGAVTLPPPRHELLIFNPAGEDVTALLTAYDAEGVVGEQQVDVVAPGPTRVDVNGVFSSTGLSVLVESEAGELVVEHRVYNDEVADQVPCATTSSNRWFFPAQTTVRNTGATLYLFNPFGEDASVDITADVGEGVRAPAEWQGLVVPAGTTKALNLGEFFQVRPQLAVDVRVRNGNVVAETSQLLATPRSDDGSVAATRGLRLQVGVPRPASDWVFASGFTGPGALERLVLYNPGDEPARALVQVTPYGAAELPPEPFELEVPARRFSQLDLSAETRIPTEGLHAIRVETDPDTPLVAGRVITVVDQRQPPSSPEIFPRPLGSLGTAIGTGTPDAAALWAATGLLVGGRRESAVMVHNPSTDTVRVTATVIGGPADGKVLADALEVAPGDSLAVRTRDQDIGSGDITIVVEATAPVVVERTESFLNQNDFSMGLAVPLPTERQPLTPVGQ